MDKMERLANTFLMLHPIDIEVGGVLTDKLKYLG